MDDGGLKLSVAEITKADLPELTRVMTRAFDDDSRKHLGKERGGPEGYDDGGFFRKWLFGQKLTDGYKALHAGRIVAAAIVWILPKRDNILGNIFVDPDFQDRGVGTRFWRWIEQRYPTAKSWRLTTPEWAVKNHHFYEAKCGFRRVDRDPLLGAPDGQFVYCKEMAPAGRAEPSSGQSKG
jgi:GNAT superfamily N-acetyltransferase